MPSFNFVTDIGMENIAREGALVLIAGINDELIARDTSWAVKDEELADAQGITYYECISDPVESSKIHSGHRPSFIENSVENYPNLCVMAYTASNSPFRNLDQGEDVAITFYIEGMVKQGPYDPTEEFIEEAEILVNKKVQRMVESVHKVISDNDTLNGLIDPIENVPAVSVTDCMRRKDITANGALDYYWSMFRLEYTVNRSIQIGF